MCGAYVICLGHVCGALSTTNLQSPALGQEFAFRSECLGCSLVL
jgi:hypothetical protein